MLNTVGELTLLTSRLVDVLQPALNIIFCIPSLWDMHSPSGSYFQLQFLLDYTDELKTKAFQKIHTMMIN